METQITTKVDQKVQLVDGVFTPSEAMDVIGSLIDQKINFHKFQRLKSFEGDDCADNAVVNRKIISLEHERNMAKMHIAKARKAGTNVRIDGILHLSLDY